MPVQQQPTNKLSSCTLVTGRERGNCISALTATRKVLFSWIKPCDAKFLPLWKKPPTSKGSGQTQPLSAKFSSLAAPHFTFQSKQNNQKANCKETNQKSIQLLWVTIPFLSDQETALLQLDFNIHVLSARLATLNTLKPYHVLSQEHTSTKCFNRPTLSFTQCSFIYHTGCTQRFRPFPIVTVE